jgi:hypothetical protein
MLEPDCYKIPELLVRLFYSEVPSKRQCPGAEALVTRGKVHGRVIRHRTSIPRSSTAAAVERQGSHRCDSSDHPVLRSRTQLRWSCRSNTD